MEIANGMNITTEYLSWLFTNELLTSNKIKIYEVAKKIDYNDSKYFSKVFKVVTGKVPKEYMKFY